MKKTVRKIVVLLCVVSFAITLLAGCEEQGLADTRKTRLIAVENLQLKEQLKQCSQTIEQQKQSQKGSQDLRELSYEYFTKENVELRQENEDLKAQIEELKKELEK